jgi:hypothetical protein
LRHTFGQRLRETGVKKEDRDALLGHTSEEMSDHYAASTVARLIDQANLVAGTRGSTTLLRLMNEGKFTQKVTQRKMAYKVAAL